jgi:hypothetical protein
MLGGVVFLLWPRLCAASPLVRAATILAAPYVLWWVAMPNFAAIHEYELMLLAPAAALAIAAVGMSLAEAVDEYIDTRLGWRGVGYLILFAGLLASLYSGRDMSPDPHVQPQEALQPNEAAYGTAIREATPLQAVVLSPSPSLVPVYYSERHIIRLVADDDVVERVLPEVERDFPGSPIYVAVPAAHLQSWGAEIPGLSTPTSAFRRTLQRCSRVSAPAELLLVRCR